MCTTSGVAPIGTLLCEYICQIETFFPFYFLFVFAHSLNILFVKKKRELKGVVDVVQSYFRENAVLDFGQINTVTVNIATENNITDEIEDNENKASTYKDENQFSMKEVVLNVLTTFLYKYVVNKQTFNLNSRTEMTNKDIVM